MRFLDFIFYYLVMWFKKKKDSGLRVKPLDRSLYILSLCSISWALIVEFIVEFKLYGTYVSKGSTLSFALIGGLSYFVFKKVYLTNGRYRRIKEGKITIYNVSDKIGMFISMIFFILSILGVLLLAFVLH